MKNIIKLSAEYIRVFLKWLIIATVIGLVGGLLGSAFHLSVDYVTELRTEHRFIICFLPVGGIVIAALYRMFHSKGRLDTDRVMEAVRDKSEVPLIMVPLIFVSTVITHLFGGSAGREGAALQLGGGIGYNIGKLLRLNEKDMHVIVMSGMSSVFSALFGTPLTAAIFSLEVISVGVFNYAGIVPCLIASVIAYMTATMLGIPPVRFGSVVFETLSVELILKVIVLALLCAVLSILFCEAIEKCEKYMDRFIHNCYVRAAVGGAILVALTLIVRSYDYNGAGMDVITRAISGEAKPEAFILKILFTAITIAAGFKGGEIVPSFFIGSTFGCVAAPLLGLESSFGAAIGFTAMFCGVVNCPIASMILAIEVFGTEGLLLFAIACAVSYMMSGKFGLYRSQNFINSKINE